MEHHDSPRRPLIWPACIEQLRDIVPADPPVYLVGGAVRDAYLHRPLHDIDLATPGDGRPLARHIANHFQGAYYALDPERRVGRALITWEGEPLTIDVAQLRGPDLVTDLRYRDFTINALAVRLQGDLQTVIDPLGGLDDLAARRLRQCDPDAIPNDPVRALRAVRMSVSFRLSIEPLTQASLRAAGAALASSSAERLRDEFFQILSGLRSAAALRVLDGLGLLAVIVPETQAMHGVSQTAPHQFDVWEHTLKTVEGLGTILDLLASTNRSEDLAPNIQAGALAVALRHLQAPLRTQLDYSWPNGRAHRGLLLLAALLHDCGKPATRSVDAQGRVHFYDHDQVGARLAENRAAALRLSNQEVARLVTIVRHHMRPHWLHTGLTLSPRAIYRFWRDTGPAGVDIILLAAADYLATYGVMLDSAAWAAYVAMLQTLLTRYHEQRASIAPSPLLTGQQVMEHFGLTPGPQLGQLLEQLQEAQAIGEVCTQQQALEWIQRLLDQSAGRENPTTN